MSAQPYFSEDLVAAILVRVSGKSLIRFKCVSKQWNLLISDSNFIKSHLNTKRDHKMLFFYNRFFYSNRLEYVTQLSTSRIKSDFFDEIFRSSPRSLEAEETQHPLDPSSVICDVMHCDGMLLCIYESYNCEERNRNMVVWNPLTKQHKMFYIQQDSYKYILWEAFGFGYDSSIDDYKAVRVMGNMSHPRLKIQSMSLKKGSWDDGVQIDLSSSIFISEINNVGNFVNGCLYWIAMNLNGIESKEISLVYYDLEKNIIREETSPPPELLTGSHHVLEVLEGSLCLGMKTDVVQHSEWLTCTDIWVMKEDGSSGTKFWTHLFRVEDDYFMTSDTKIMTFTPGGKIITMKENANAMYLTNPYLKYKSVRKILLNNDDSDILFWVYMVQYEESLVSLNV